MKKRLLIILTLLFVTGCTGQYSLKIDKDKITEEINVTLDRSKFVDGEILDDPDGSIYSQTSLRHALEADRYPLVNSIKEKYEKTIVENGNNVNMKLTYTYPENTLKDSNMFYSCFEKVNVVETKKEIHIKLSGEYYCLSTDVTDMDFTISTSNKVISSNQTSKIANTYKWDINQYNKDNINVEIKMLKQSMYFYYGLRIAIGVAIVVGIIAVYGIYVKIKNRDELNKV